MGITLALLIGLVAPAAAAAPSCQDVSLPVQLDVLLPAQVHGRLCVPAGGASRVQLLVHGATYDSRYWDEPVGDYSYVRHAVGDGWATLAIDRVGYGQSSRELSATLTATTQATTVHQIIGQLRAGSVGGQSFAKVLLVGHSVGSAVSLIETSLYNDADAVALTGVTHRISPDELAAIFATSIRPVTVDPSPLTTEYDPGYLTTVPGTRAALFYGPHPDPELLAYDEATKGVVSATEAADAIALGFTLPTSLAVTVPVYLVDGGADAIFCGHLLGGQCSDAAALTAEEAPYFANAASFTAATLPGAGHDLNFEADASVYETALNTWADTTT
ncbi:alpha/beta hydrolase [Kutzneria sp. CA-103260]|uniref:alpha/beta hydrolase n=1 Tax=Kutzneria sp. CA-103260 TaxID=2802641 RepID=UPI00201380ED|nr:alpha/beta fold hydrolase [Kutzneria sp. CA-103260]